jgi:hypothetical protein
MPNCSEKNFKLFLWIANLTKYIPNYLEKNYKLFLWIADLGEIYTKLFTNVKDRTYQNADANGQQN